MATQVQNRRGTTAEHSTFTGANGELTVDTTKWTLVVHDGATAGGRPLLREDQSNLPTSAPTTGIYNASGSLAFSTTADGASSPTKRMIIGANGYIHASNTGSYYSTGTFHELSGNSATDASLLVGSFNTSKNHGNTSACLVVADYDSDYTNSNLFGGWNVTNNSWRILIRGNGNVENVNNSYGAISDVKLKENIVNAGSQWDDLKALQVRKYNFKEGKTHTQIGLVAQEVELVSPGLVSESLDRDAKGNALGTVTKSVNYSVLYMKAVKALQEAMERIETLEAKVAALEA